MTRSRIVQRRLAFLLSAVIVSTIAAASCKGDGYVSRAPSLIDAGAPPPRFRGDTEIRVRFVAPNRVAKECDRENLPAGQKVLACTRLRSNGDHLMILANPCAEDPDEIACHEIGHVNGWPATHGG